MQLNPLNQLAELGQSIWYDNIQRSILTSGELARMIAEDSLTGLTSNPTIFDKAISKSTDYDDPLTELLSKASQMSTISLYEALAINDIQAAADLMRPVYDRTQGVDGYVSLEVSPKLAYNSEGSITEGQRLFKMVNRPNLMIKIPATSAGLPAITALIGEGINVNATLMFSLEHYNTVSEAYLSGLEKLDASGGDLSKVASVASFFVSRVDTIFDKALEAIGTDEALGLRGKMGVANVKATYRRFEEVFDSDRFKALKAKGARVQRPLWASTSTKNPNYSDVLYVDNLIGPNTVNTMPPATIVAFKDHGQAETTLTKEVDEALETMAKVEALGISYTELTETLQTEGVAAFVKSFEDLLTNLEAKRKEIQPLV
jgi:transaldolase